MKKYIDFTGDGRMKIEPPDGALGAQPMAVTRAAARHAIERFERSGTSFHSRQGRMLWVILAHCFQAGIPFEMIHIEGGTEITRIPGEISA